MRAIDISRPTLVGVAFALFALSGISGLIYQSIWSQYMGLYLGHAAYAQSLVLAIFMGGMAIGAWLVSRVCERWRNVLRMYAFVEAAIGFLGFAFHWLYLGTTHIAYERLLPALSSDLAIQAFKWTSGTVLLLPQSILLGMTFPLMSASLLRLSKGKEGSILSGLYFTNSIGASSGALLATFVLLPWGGLPGAMNFGGALNLALAFVALMISQSPDIGNSQNVERKNNATNSGLSLLRFMLSAAFVTGASSFIYEIGWVRMLSLAFGSTMHSFELMLAAFIGGLACGGLWLRSRIDRIQDLMRFGGYVQVCMGLAALFSLILYSHSFEWVKLFLSSLSRTDGAYTLYNLGCAAISIAIMLPAAFFAGMTLPLFTAILLRAGYGEASVGRVYAANTLGAIIGVFATVHLLIPEFGLMLTMVIAGTLDIVLGLLLIRPSTSERKNVYLFTMVLSAIGIGLVIRFASFDPLILASGVYRTGNATVGDRSIGFYKDGKTATVAVVDRGSHRTIITNGKPDAAIQTAIELPPSPDEITMTLLAALPLSIHPHPASVANIGFGSGMTTHTFLGDPRVQRVDTVEIEPVMVVGAKAFGSRVERAYKDPRSNIHFDDAKTYFSTRKENYDIIVSEPSNPWVSGVASLFTTEFYQFIGHHLNSGGLFVQWIQLYEIDEELVSAIVNTLTKSFPNFDIYLANNWDMIIVASSTGELPELNNIVFQNPTLAAELAHQSVRSLADLRLHRLARRSKISPLFQTASSRINSDFYPIVSLEAPRTRFRGLDARGIFQLAFSDIPLLEIMTDEEAISSATDISGSKVFTRAANVVSARAIRQFLLNNLSSLDLVEPEIRTAITNLQSFSRTCADVADPDFFLNVLKNIAQLTIPNLTTQELEGIWIHPRWLNCPNMPSRIASMMGVYDSLSRRDGHDMQISAKAMLEDNKSKLPQWMPDYLLRVAMLGAIKEKKFEEVISLDESLGKNIAVTPTSFYERLYMLAFARSMINPKTSKNSGAASAEKFSQFPVSSTYNAKPGT